MTMNVKNLTTVLLLLFVGASVVVLVIRGRREEPQGEQPSVAATSATVEEEPLADGMIAYYFHGSTRCPTCETIEAYGHEAIQSGFANQIREGSVQWRVLDYEQPDQEEVVDKFEVLASVVVLARVENGQETKWSRLDRVWDLTDDKEAFVAYVQEEAHALMQ
jgi:hypothetical protein